MTPRQAPLVLLTFICVWLALRTPAMLADLAAYRSRLVQAGAPPRPALMVAGVTLRRPVRATLAPPSAPDPDPAARAWPVHNLLPQATPAQVRPVVALDPLPADDGPPAFQMAKPEELASSSIKLPHAIATRAYAFLRGGDRRRAAAALALAIDAAGRDPAASQWRADLSGLTKRWFVDAYAVVRPDGQAGASSGDPRVLGGTQYGLNLRWRADPLARRPLDLTARLVRAPPTLARSPAQGQAAVGVAWRPLADVPATLSLERLISVEGDARNDWLARVAGGAGGERAVDGGRQLRWLAWSVYGEANVVGLKRGDLSGGFDARLGIGFALSPALALAPDIGVGAQAERSPGLLARLEAGPGLTLDWRPATLGLSMRLGYRWRLAGDARPERSPLVAIAIAY